MPFPSRSGAGPSGNRSTQIPQSSFTNSKPDQASKKQPTQGVAPVSRKGMVAGVGNRCNSTLTAKEVELANWKRRKNYDPMKAAAQAKKKEANLVKKGIYSGTESPNEELVPAYVHVFSKSL